MSDEFTREYSKRLGVLTGAQLQAALTRFDLGALLAAEPAPGGLFGQNVLLETTVGGYVLRGNPHYDGQFEKERYFSGIVHNRTQARAPWPFLIEKSAEIFGWSFALMPLLPGMHLSDGDVRKSLTPDDRLGIAMAMGRHLALVQRAKFDVPGQFDHATGDLAPFAPPYADHVAARVRYWLGLCLQASPATTGEDVAWIDAMIAAAGPSLSADFSPVLVHTDYAEGNVVAERTPAGWEIRGVFDLGEAFIGDGDYDLARLACAYGQRDGRLRAFIDAYSADAPPRPGFRERLALYIVADRLIIWEYGQRNGIWFTDPQQSFRSWAEPFVALAEAAARV